MKINYDPKADALDIVFKKGIVHETRELGNEMFLDVDKKGNPLSLEILDSSKKLPKNESGEITLSIPSIEKKINSSYCLIQNIVSRLNSYSSTIIPKFSLC